MSSSEAGRTPPGGAPGGPRELLEELARLGVELRADGERLVCNAPKGVLTPVLAATIREHKAALLAEASRRDTPDGPIPRVSREGPLPLGFVQERMWLHDLMQPDTVLYSLPASWRLTGSLDRAALNGALRDVVERHEVMRCRLEEPAAPVQRFDAPIPDEIPFEDASDVPEAEREEWLRLRLEQARDVRFDFARGPLWQALLIRLGPEEHVLFFMPHHVIWDGWSFDVFLSDLAEFYAARAEERAPRLGELPVQYADYAVWHRAWLRGGEAERQTRYWKSALSGEMPPLDLPTDRPRPPVFSHRGSLIQSEIGGPEVAALAELGRPHGATVFMVFLAAWQAFLHRLTGQEKIVVGVPIQARQRPEVAGLIGCFVNTLVLRGAVTDERPFDALLAEVAGQATEAYEHQDVPFDMLLQELDPERSPSRTPLFQAMLSHQQTSRRPRAFGSLAVGQVHVDPGASPTDLTLGVMEGDDGAGALFLYNTDIFSAASVEALRLRFEAFLGGILEAPSTPVGDLPFLTPEEREQVVVEWNRTTADYPRDAGVADAFAERARENPEAVAVEFGTERLTYAELEAAANRLARRLESLGVGPGSIVGVHLERSPRLVEALLGVLKAGAAYLPLDPEYPDERLRFMVEHSGAAVVLTEEALQDVLAVEGSETLVLETEAPALAALPATPPERRARPEDLAYVIYTSGSTGRPKGVRIPHRAAVNFLCSMARRPGLSSSDRLLAVTTTSFDISVLELFLPLSVGATILLASRDEVLEGQALAEIVASRRATVLQATPATWRLLLQADWKGAPGLKALCGGEALDPGLARDLLPRVAELWNMYGPTETTVWSTCARIDSPEDVTVGRPIDNTTIYVLDARRRPVPPGLVGELFIGGDGVADGYHRQDEMTAERFVEDPFRELPESRMYRTGDQARWLPDGRLECLGRIDHQVKVRGFRIELGEIEAGLESHEGVRQAVAVVREFGGSDPRLVAYVVPQGDDSAPSAALRRWLRTTLPDYMIPSVFVHLDQLPLTPNGKVDRRALPSPTGPDPAEAPEAPRTPLEEIVSRIWSEVLGVDEVGRDADFFELGGHSLLAAQVVARVREVFGIELPLREILTSSTVEQLSARVEERRGSAPDGPNRILLGAQPYGGPEAMSYAQQRMWFLEQIEAGSPDYVITGAWRVRGPLEPGVLEEALSGVVARHESLRTSFGHVDEDPVQRVSESVAVPLELVEAAGEAELDTLMREQIGRGFDLGSPPLLRTVLYRLAPEEHVLLLTVHHIISDGWSVRVFFEELWSLYGSLVAGSSPSLPDLPVQYRDFARWQRESLAGADLEREIAHWQKRLEGAPQVVELPTDRPRPAIETHRGAEYAFAVSPELSQRLEGLARREKVTPFMVLLAAFGVLLWRYTRQEDLLIGTPVGGRGRPELDGLVGMFINTIALRTDLSGNPSVVELLDRVRDVCLDAYTHHHLPFERLVQALQPERDMSRQPLVQVMLVFENGQATMPEVPHLSLAPQDVDRSAAHLDLTLYLAETSEGLKGTFEYASDLFDRDTIHRMAGHFGALLHEIVERPESPVSDLELVSGDEREAIAAWNRTEADIPSECVHELIARQATRAPERTAVEAGERSLSYGMLESAAVRLASQLRGLGVKPGVRVGVFLGRGPEMVAGILGVLKAGGAYVPLDPAFPRDRLLYMLEDSGASVLMTEEGLLDELPASSLPRLVVSGVGEQGPEDSGPDGPTASAEDAAYVIYTSGSTGKPKGVVVTHGNLVNFLASMARRPGLDANDVVLAVTTLSFDIAALELYLPLMMGGRVVVAGHEEAADGRRLLELLGSSGVTTMQATPATWRLLIESGWESSPGLKVLCGGEALSEELARELLSRAGEVWNMYGPTETTVWSSLWRVEAGKISVGRPIANTQMYVLDALGRQQPIGVPGELFIGGAGVARGYWQRPELTAERFVEDPFRELPESRMYRTGDQARWLPDGRLECLGRIDHQVKVRGFRIELGEIEAGLESHEGVRQAVAVVREFGGSDPRLVAYVVPQGEDSAPSAALRRWLRTTLPDYMIPSVFVHLDQLPLTPNGKVDRRALPSPDTLRQGGGTREPLRTPTEQLLGRLWSELLSVDAVGRGDNFFDLGGHSLLAMRLVRRVASETGVRLNPRELLFRSLEQLAAACDENGAAATPQPERQASPGWRGRLRRLFSH